MVVTQGETPVVRLRRLRAELRKLRDEAGHTQKFVAESLGWSTSKMIRIETGAVNVSMSDLRALLHFYRVSDNDRTDELLAITRIKEATWWDQYRENYPNDQFINFLAYEDSAARILQFMGLVIPGLLQTEDYMRALFSGYVSDLDEIDRGVRIRTQRQGLISRASGPKLMFVLDEAVIHRWIGGAQVMRTQLMRLKEVAEMPHVSLRIVPFTAGIHPGMRGSFTIFEFPSVDEDFVVNIEDPHRDVLIRDDPEISSKYVETFYELQEVAQPESDTNSILDRMIGLMEKG